MILHPCPGCGKLIPKGERRCASCLAKQTAEQPEQIRQSQRRYNENRDPKLTAFYKSKAWRMTSAAKLAQDPLCEAKLEGCQRIACEVHHIKPLRTEEGWRGRLDGGGLMSVCTHCHNILDGKWGKATRRRRDDGGEEDVIDLSTI